MHKACTSLLHFPTSYYLQRSAALLLHLRTFAFGLLRNESMSEHTCSAMHLVLEQDYSLQCTHLWFDSFAS